MLVRRAKKEGSVQGSGHHLEPDADKTRVNNALTRDEFAPEIKITITIRSGNNSRIWPLARRAVWLFNLSSS
jgi:hypothetical protein